MSAESQRIFANSGTAFRRDCLKAYVMACAASGEFTDLRPTAMVRKALSLLALDLPAVLKEIAGTMMNQAAEHGVRKVGDVVIGKAEDIARDIAKRGVAAVWNDMQTQYRRGADRLAKHDGKRAR